MRVHITHLCGIEHIGGIKHSIMAYDRLETEDVVSIDPIRHVPAIGSAESGRALGIDLWRSA